MAAKTRKTRPRSVDFINNEEDYHCILYAMLGMATRFISKQTGLTECQIGYRKHKADVRVTDFRLGKSHTAQQVIRNAHSIAGGYTDSYLEDNFAPVEERKKRSSVRRG